MRENTRGYRRKTVNLHVELVSDGHHHHLLDDLEGVLVGLPPSRLQRSLMLQLQEQAAYSRKRVLTNKIQVFIALSLILCVRHED
jgi:hypothetical protein